MARVVHYTGRYAHLVGYDPADTRSSKIPIVTADLKVKAHNGIPVILRIHETPYNQHSPITLLSEYQIRETGLVIDSVASKHKSSNKEFGKQRFELNDVVHVPFEDRGGLMGFEILPYEQGDEDRYDVFEITHSTKWTPARFKDQTKTNKHEPPDFDAHLQTAGKSILRTGKFSFTKEPEVEDFNFEESDLTMAFAVADIPEIDPSFILDYSNDLERENTEDVATFLSHLTYKELMGTKKCNSEYYGYPPFPEDENTTDDMVLHGNSWCNLLFCSTKQGKTFDAFSFAVRSWHRVVYKDIDPKKVQPFLGWRPLEVVKNTLQHTTQLARMSLRAPLIRHFKARFPWLNVKRLDEAVSTDPFFANCKSIGQGFTGAYLFMGLDSRYLNLYGFRPKGRNFAQILRDFFREEGAPTFSGLTMAKI